MGRTLYEKVYDAHVVTQAPGELPLLYIDRHLIHEVTSPQAFAGLRDAGRKLRRPDLTLATMDHDISTQKATLDVCSPMAKKQVTTLISNCKEFSVTLLASVTQVRGSCISLGHKQALRFLALRLSVGTLTRQHTALLGLSPSGLALLKWNTSLPHKP